MCEHVLYVICRQAPDTSPRKPVTGKPSVSTVLSDLSKIAESTRPSPTPEFSVSSHPFYSSSTTSTGKNDRSGTKSHDYGDWSKPGDVGVKLAVNQALLYTVQVSNSMAGKDDKKMEYTKSES